MKCNLRFISFRFVHLAPEHATKQPFPVDPQYSLGVCPSIMTSKWPILCMVRR